MTSHLRVSKTTGIRAVAYKGDFSDLVEADPVFINIVPNYNLNVSVEGQGNGGQGPVPMVLTFRILWLSWKAVPK